MFSLSNNIVHPINLLSYDKDFYTEIQNSGFCWRWVNRNGQDFRVLTIEGQSNHPQLHNRVVSPLQLQSRDPAYKNDIHNCHFNWRYLRAGNGTVYKCVTIETAPQGYATNLSQPQIVPQFLIWSPDTGNDINYSFNWRYLQGENGERGFVTLE